MRSWTHIHLRHLRCFIAVAQQGSLKQAADSLGVTVAAVSKTLTELEEILGQPLLQRLHSGARLTPAGEVFSQFALASLRNVREAWDAMDPAGSLAANPIRIGALPNIAASVLPEAICAMLDQQPHTRADVHTGTNAELLAGLSSGRLDIVMGRMGDPSQMVGLTFEHLYSEPLIFVGRADHPMLTPGVDSLNALQTAHIVFPTLGTRIRRDADEFFARRGLPLPRTRTESTSASFAMGMVHRSDAVWFGPWGVVEPGVKQQQLHVLPIDTSDSLGPVGLTLRQEQQLSHTGQEFVRHLRSIAARRREDPWRSWLQEALTRKT